MFCTGCGNVLLESTENKRCQNVVLLIVSLHAPIVSTMDFFGHVLVKVSSIACIRSFVFTGTKHLNNV